jgi:putative tricarboxylic transport membrane protein
MGVGIAVAINSYKLKLQTLANPGPGLMPFFLGIILSVCSLPIIVRSFLAIKKNREQKDESIWSGIEHKRIILVMASLVLYWMFLEKVGFLGMTSFLLFILFKTVGSQKWYSALITSVLVVVLVFLAFVVCLQVELPVGFLKIRIG